MPTLPSSEAAEPLATGSQRPSALRSTLYTLLAVALAAGLWVRFNTQIAAIAPALAGPDGLVASQAADPSHIRGLVQLSLLPESQAAAAVSEMGLPQGDAAALTQALQRGRLRLAHLPLLDDSPVLQGGGHAVQVSSGGYTRLLMLTREPTVVTLPVGPVGTVSFSTPETTGVGIVGLTLSGPVRLPELQAGQVFSVGVIAQ